MYYTVCEVAKRLNLSPHTIRFYAKEGLLSFKIRFLKNTISILIPVYKSQ